MQYFIKRKNQIDTNQVILLQAVENYTLFHLQNGTVIISSLTLKTHQEKLASVAFIRVNRSMLINASFVKRVGTKKAVKYIHLKNGKQIKVSRRRQDTLNELIF